MTAHKTKPLRRFLRWAGSKFRLREALIVGIIVTIPVVVVWFIISMANSFVGEIISDSPFSRYLRFPFAGFLTGATLIYLIGFFLTSQGRVMRSADWVLNRVPGVRKLWPGLRAIVKKIRRTRARVPVLVEEYGGKTERWRVSYCLGVIQMDEPFLHPEMLVISPVPSQLLGADPRLMPPSDRIFVLEGGGSRGALLGMVLSMGSISPERAGGFTIWSEWAARNPGNVDDLKQTRAARKFGGADKPLQASPDVDANS